MAKIEEQYISNGKFISRTTEEILVNPYTEKSDILALFNTRCDSVLIDPVTITDNAGFDDGARNTAINQKGWTHSLDYTSEGSSGLIINGYTARNSGFSYTRMYYSVREPDYQIICRRDGNDQYFISSIIKYDENNIFFYCKLRQLSSSFFYDYFWQISKDYSTIEILFKNNEAWSNATMLIGIKKYSRTTNAWSPASYTGINDTSIKYYSTGIASTSEASIKESDIQSKIISDKFKNPIIKNYISKKENKLNGFYKNDENISSYELFIEGVESNKEVTIKFFNKNGFYEYGITQLNGITHINKRSKFQEYEISTTDNLEYKRTIKPYSKMIRGYISGNVTLSNCEVHYSQLYVLCLRNDGVKIGEYPVSPSYSYNIPNLDVNTKYNIILIDKNKDIEWIVSSFRPPKPYAEVLGPAIIETIYFHNSNNQRCIRLSVSDLSKIDYIKIYYSMNQIDETNMDKIPYFYSNDLITNVHNYYSQGYIYFAAVIYFNNMTSNIIKTINHPYNLTMEVL